MKTKMCPFCGSNETYLRSQGTRYGTLVFVECGVCGAKTKVYKKQNENPKSKEYWEDVASLMATDAWNRRAKGV